MEFTFSIRENLRAAWGLFKRHVWFFVGLAAVSVALNFIGNGESTPIIVRIILVIATFVWSIILIKFSLAAAYGKEELLSFKHIRDMLPSWKQALGIIGVGFLSGLLTLAGLILLIIPGLWVAFRLSLSNFVFIDKGLGIRKSVRTSWNMTRGPVFWTTVLVGITAALLYIVGIVLVGVGILVTYPLAMILMARFYHALSIYRGIGGATGPSTAPIVVQPEEIEAPADEAHHEGDMAK